MEKRELEEIYRDMRQTQAIFDSVSLEVALLRATLDTSVPNKHKIGHILNGKVSELKSAEQKMRALEEELANSK